MSAAKALMGPTVAPGVQADPNGHVWADDWLNVEGGFRCVLCRTPGYREADAPSQCPRAGRPLAGLAVAS